MLIKAMMKKTMRMKKMNLSVRLKKSPKRLRMRTKDIFRNLMIQLTPDSMLQ